MAEKIIIDTNVFLNVSNREEEFFSSSKKLLDLVDSGEIMAIISTVTIAELSTVYRLMGEEAEWRKDLLHMQASENYVMVDMDVEVADKTGEIRAKTSLAMPDAIIVASGIIHNVKYIVTNDHDFGINVKDLVVLTPSEFIEALG